MSNKKHLLTLFAICIFTYSFIWAADYTSTLEITPSKINPISSEVIKSLDFDTNDSVGFFVGVRFFYDGDGRISSTISEVPYACDDAVDLAYLFSEKLKLIKAKNIILALSGEPQKETSKLHLMTLKSSGATITDAKFTNLLSQLRRAQNLAGKKGLLVMSFHTHGYSQKGDKIFGQDSMLADIEETGISVAKIIDAASSSKAPRRLIFVDACREKLETGRLVSSEKSVMSDHFKKALSEAKGMVVMSGTTIGGYAYDDPIKKNGVFTNYIIEGLLGDAQSDERGFITPETLSKYVDAKVKEWVKVNRPNQTESSRGITCSLDDIGSARLPLAVNSESVKNIEETENKKKQLLEIVKKNMDFKHITGDMVQDIANIINTNSYSDLEPLVKRIENLDKLGSSYTEDFAIWWNNKGKSDIISAAEKNKEKQESISISATSTNLLEQAIGYYIGTFGNVDYDKAKELFQKAADGGDPVAKMYVAFFHYAIKCNFADDLNKAKRIGSEIIDKVKSLAEKEELKAIVALGFAYMGGLGVEENREKAYEFFTKAAEKGDTMSMALLAYMYEQGLGVASDYSKSMEWYKKAVDKGNVNALVGVGGLYDTGKGVDKDYAKAFEWYKKAADKGSPVAMFSVGTMYHVGQGVEKDFTKAEYWYNKAGEKGDATLLVSIARMFFVGTGGSPDYSRALEWYTKAANKGSGLAMCYIGNMYDNGQGVEKSYVKAFEWYKKAAESGDTTGMYNLGNMYDAGQGVERDYTKAFEWYKKAAENGNVSSMFSVGSMYHLGQGVPKDYFKAMDWYKKAAENGNGNAMLSIGTMYDVGHGIEKDFGKAFEWYKKSADKGNNIAMFNIGSMYQAGQGVEKDLKKAYDWYKRAAENGNSSGMCFLGHMYRKGEGVQQNYSEALDWYYKAVDKDDSNAMLFIGSMYDNGQGVEKSLSKAFEWYKKAAEKGNSTAMFNIGNMYQYGDGVSLNITIAKEWYQKAADLGNESAKKKLNELND